jgi:hypothetical protein
LELIDCRLTVAPLSGLASVAYGPGAGACTTAYSVKRSTSPAPLAPRRSDHCPARKVTLTLTLPLSDCSSALFVIG